MGNIIQGTSKNLRLLFFHTGFTFDNYDLSVDKNVKPMEKDANLFLLLDLFANASFSGE